MILDAKAAAGIDEFDLVAIGAQAAHKVGDALHGIAKGTDAGDLRSDVHADAGRGQITIASEVRYSPRASSMGTPNLCL